MSEKLNELMDAMEKMARETIATDEGGLMPMFHAEDKDGVGYVYVTDTFNDEDSKAAFLLMLFFKFREQKVVRYVMVSEAWAAHQIEGDTRMPRDRDDKREILVIGGVERDGDEFTLLHRVYEIDSQPGSRTVAEKNEVEDGATFGGQMLGLLNAEPPVSPMAVARFMLANRLKEAMDAQH